jgi:hypothetical protein
MSDHQGTPVSAAARGLVSAAADPASPLHCPHEPLGCQATFWPPSARQRARTEAAPCLHRSASQGHSGQHRRRCALPVRLMLLAPTPPRGSADRLPHPPLVLSGLFSLLVSVWNVLPQGSRVKAWPRGVHQQDRHHGLVASAGRRACQTGFGAGGPRAQALDVPGDRWCTRVPDAPRA